MKNNFFNNLLFTYSFNDFINDRNKIDRKIRIHFYSKEITLKTGTVVLNKILLDVLLNCCKMTDYYNLLYHKLISNYFIIRLSAINAITIVLLPVPPLHFISLLFNTIFCVNTLVNCSK